MSIIHTYTDISANDDLEDLSLEDLEVVTPLKPKKSPTTLTRDEICYWDYVPNEVLLNIYNYLDETDVGRMGIVSRRLYDLLDDERVWSEKCKSWVGMTGEDTTGKSKEYFINKYLEHKGAGDIIDISSAHKSTTEKLKKWVGYSRYCGFSFYSMEVPFFTYFLIWSILLPIRADEYLLCSYHFIFIPVYFAFFHLLVALILTDIFVCAFGKYNDWKVINFITLILSAMTPCWEYRKISLYVGTLGILASFIVLAEYEDQTGSLSDSGYIYLPLIIMIGIFIFFWLIWKKHSVCFENKTFVGFGVGIPTLVVVSIILLIWAKSSFIETYDWYSAFSLWWILLLCGAIALFITWPIYLCSHTQSRDSKLYLALLTHGTITVVFLTIWFALLSNNLESQYRDLPMYGWVPMFIPLWIFMISCIGGSAYLGYWIDTNP
eukprot:TRINITY_DN6999_c0_g1_i2.p1 TRINITY_DN6999_c0_g1~~TRINITY_DN6999_c0_g1_i2.p1  ORF type:complete len:435 (-),score=18.81 TRINITY_DN6999_c0_g1_i2:221-1525(-)